MKPIYTGPFSPPTLRGLYAITSQAMCATGSALLICVEAALRGGVRWVQYRDKQSPPDLRQRQARVLLQLCHNYDAALIINDDIEMARAVRADGVHLGADDAPIAAAREQLGAEAIIGASCGASLQRAQDAFSAGANYAAFGRFFASNTKPEAPPAGLELLAEARRRLDQPLCAIGGITPDNASPLIAAGADMVAAVDGIFGNSDPTLIEAAARDYARCFVSAQSVHNKQDDEGPV